MAAWQIKARAAFICLPASPPFHCERWNYFTENSGRGKLAPKQGNLYQNRGSPGTHCSLPDGDVHVEYLACYPLPNRAPPWPCTRSIQRRPSVVTHNQAQRWVSGSMPSSCTLLLQCAYTARDSRQETKLNRELQSSLPLVRWLQQLLHQSANGKNQGKESEWQEQQIWSKGFSVPSICN